MVLGQEAGKEHAVPMLVGDLFNQTVDFLNSGPGVTPVAQVPSVHPEAETEFPILLTEVSKRRGFTHTELFQSSTSRCLCDLAGFLDGPFESFSEGFV